MQVLHILQAAAPSASYTNPGKLFHLLVPRSVPTIRSTAALNVMDSTMTTCGEGRHKLEGTNMDKCSDFRNDPSRVTTYPGVRPWAKWYPPLCKAFRSRGLCLRSAEPSHRLIEGHPIVPTHIFRGKGVEFPAPDWKQHQAWRISNLLLLRAWASRSHSLGHQALCAI